VVYYADREYSIEACSSAEYHGSGVCFEAEFSKDRTLGKVLLCTLCH